MQRYKGYVLSEYIGGGWYATWGYKREFEAKTIGALKGKITRYLNKVGK